MRISELHTYNVYHGGTLGLDPDRGIFFTTDEEYAKGYSDTIHKCKVHLKNPIIYTEEESQGNMEIDRLALINQGYDGRIIKYNDGHLDVIAFYTEQISCN